MRDVARQFARLRFSLPLQPRPSARAGGLFAFQRTALAVMTNSPCAPRARMTNWTRPIHPKGRRLVPPVCPQRDRPTDPLSKYLI